MTSSPSQKQKVLQTKTSACCFLSDTTSGLMSIIIMIRDGLYEIYLNILYSLTAGCSIPVVRVHGVDVDRVRFSAARHCAILVCTWAHS